MLSIQEPIAPQSAQIPKARTLKDLLTNKHQNPTTNTHFVQQGMKVSGETRVMNGLVEVKHEPIIINNNNNLHHNNNGFISNGLHVTKKVVQKSLLGEEGHKNDLTYLHHQQQVSLRPVTTSIQPKIVSRQQQQRSTTTSPNGESQPTFQKHTHNEELSTCSFIYFFHNKQSFELEKFLNGFVVLSLGFSHNTCACLSLFQANLQPSNSK